MDTLVQRLPECRLPSSLKATTPSGPKRVSVFGYLNEPICADATPRCLLTHPLIQIDHGLLIDRYQTLAGAVEIKCEHHHQGKRD
jgi:hypothetical protein